MPQQAAGWRIDPPVSVPRAAAHSSAATAAAEPPLEPPGIVCKSQGLWVAPYAECSVDEPMANSSILALPSKIAPAALRRSITVASYGGTKFPRILEPQV